VIKTLKQATLWSFLAAGLKGGILFDRYAINRKDNQCYDT
jgi:hypothetical protein